MNGVAEILLGEQALPNWIFRILYTISYKEIQNSFFPQKELNEISCQTVDQKENSDPMRWNVEVGSRNLETYSAWSWLPVINKSSSSKINACHGLSSHLFLLFVVLQLLFPIWLYRFLLFLFSLPFFSFGCCSSCVFFTYTHFSGCFLLILLLFNPFVCLDPTSLRF